MKDLVARANAEAVARLKGAQPFWVDIRPAHEVLGIDRNTLLHAGPPIAWEDMCGPMKGCLLYTSPSPRDRG